MPWADFSAIFQCPYLVDTFTILRRADKIDANGRTTPVVVATYPGHGVVTIAGANDMQRLTEHEYQRKTILVVTNSVIQGPDPQFGGRQPDIIRWKSRLTIGALEDFVVIDVQDYSNFGPGFVNVLAERFAPIGWWRVDDARDIGPPPGSSA